jgi:hypothetical protein
VLRAPHPPNAGLARLRVVSRGAAAQGAWYLGAASRPGGGLAQRAAAVLRSPRPVAPGARRTRLGAALRVAAPHVAVVAIA